MPAVHTKPSAELKYLQKQKLLIIVHTKFTASLHGIVYKDVYIYWKMSRVSKDALFSFPDSFIKNWNTPKTSFDSEMKCWML